MTLNITITLMEQVGDLAKKAGLAIMDIYNTDFEVDHKADSSPVTEADRIAEEIIIQGIREGITAQYPIVGEEAFSDGHSPNVEGTAFWLVDPLDGTTNFSLGLHFWGISIARLVEGRPNTTVLYFPIIEELYTAERGRGASLNDEPIHIQPPRVEYPLPFFACCSRTFRQYNVDVPYKIRILGSASYTFCAVARGIAVLGFEATPKIWDIAGAWLLVEEAGGTIETLHDSEPFPLETTKDYAGMDFPTLAAATPQLASKAREQIQPKRG